MSHSSLADALAQPSRHFSQSYAEARQQFLQACAEIGLPVRSHAHPLPGRDGEPLAMDLALQGPADAAALLILSSACHGVEGYCGSGVQVAMLRDRAWHDAVADAGVSVLYVHALNPYGFSWWRRTTHENVDLNRNFHDFSRPLPENAGYDRIAPLVVPDTWPPTPEVHAAFARLVAEQGLQAVQHAITSGQHKHPDGLFYGGLAPTWSHLTLRQVLQAYGRHCARLGWIDIHTGLGPCGVGERIFACRDDNAALQRARRWWGSNVTSIYDGSSTSARLTGMMWLAAYEECAQAEYTGIALEYGTVPVLELIDAMRADQWLQNHRNAPAEQRRAIKQRLRDVFYVDTDPWKLQVLQQAIDAGQQALAGLRQP